MTIPVASPTHPDDASFAMTVWTGLIGGPALSTDPDPNTTPPASSRILRATAKRDGVVCMGKLMLISAVIGDGTSLTYQAWQYDDAQAKWVKLHSTVTLTFATTNFRNLNLVPNNLSGAKIFLQITANTGCTAFGYDVR